LLPHGAPQNTSHEAAGYFLLLVFEGTAVCAPLGTRMAWFEGKNKKEKAEKHPVESFSAFCYFS